MEKIEFGKDPDGWEMYFCCCGSAVSNTVCKIDHAGAYYRASDVDALLTDVRRLVEAAKESHCPKCGGAGWVWGYELDIPDHDTATDTQTRYTCDWCRNLKQAIAAVERHFPKGEPKNDPKKD